MTEWFMVPVLKTGVVNSHREFESHSFRHFLYKKKLICPKCKSENIAEILYGLPAFDDELEKDLESGKIVLGGCYIGSQNPHFHCNDCGGEF